MAGAEHSNCNMKGGQSWAMLDFTPQNKELEIYFKCEGKPLNMFSQMKTHF